MGTGEVKARHILLACGVFCGTLLLLLSYGGTGPMESEFLQKVAVAIAPTLVTLFGSMFGEILRQQREAERHRAEERNAEAASREAERAALRALLRNELVRMHREWVEEKGYITLEALDYASQTYAAYHELGGNGTGTRLFEDMCNLPIKEERK